MKQTCRLGVIFDAEWEYEVLSEKLTLHLVLVHSSIVLFTIGCKIIFFGKINFIFELVVTTTPKSDKIVFLPNFKISDLPYGRDTVSILGYNSAIRSDYGKCLQIKVY